MVGASGRVLGGELGGDLGGRELGTLSCLLDDLKDIELDHSL